MLPDGSRLDSEDPGVVETPTWQPHSAASFLLLQYEADAAPAQPLVYSSTGLVVSLDPGLDLKCASAELTGVVVFSHICMALALQVTQFQPQSSHS